MTTSLIDTIKTDGGFTFDPHTDSLIKVGTVSGYAIAVPGTERLIGSGSITRERFADAFVAVVREFSDMIDNGAVVGGWYSAERDAYMVEITEIWDVDLDEAVEIGTARNQEGIFDLANGEFIPTGGTGDAVIAESDDPWFDPAHVGTPPF